MSYKAIIKDAPVKEVEIAYNGFEIFDTKEIESNQLGYSIDPNGQDLTGTNEGDWKKEWVVIGRDTAVGDPIFIDTLVEHFPVYTAMHGEGSWNPALFSPSLESFIQSLNLLKNIENEFNKFKNIKDSKKLEKIISEIQEKLYDLNNGCDEYLWGNIFESLEEEIEDLKEFD